MTTHTLSHDQAVFHPNRLLAAALRLFEPSFTADPSDNESQRTPKVGGAKIKAVDALSLSMQDAAMGG